MDNLSISGPKVYVRIEWLYNRFAGTMADMFGNFGNLITQTTVSLFAVTILLMILGIVGSRNISARPGRLQVVTEKLINMLYGLVEDTMGKHNLHFAPYIGTLFLSSIFGSLIGTTGIFRSATADLSVTLAWALVTTGMVWSMAQGLYRAHRGFDADEHCIRDRTASFHGVPSLW